MNEALLLGQLVLAVALVPTIYLANYYYKAYYRALDASRAVNGALVLDKFFLVTELMELQEWMQHYIFALPASEATDAVGSTKRRLDIVLAGNKRRLDKAQKAVSV